MPRSHLAALVLVAPWTLRAHAQTLISEADGPFAEARAGGALAFCRPSAVSGPVLVVGAPSMLGTGLPGWVGFHHGSGVLLQDAVGTPGDQLGWAISTSGDLEGDGFPDVVVGAPGGNLVRVWSGATLSEYPWSPIHAPIGGRFGESVAIVTDYDGDGLDDIAVGAPYDDTQGMDAGAVLIFRGIDGTGWTSGGPPVPQAGERAGTALARIADIDGDGRDDLAVGCPYYDDAGLPEAGRVTFKGTAVPVTAELVGAQAKEHYGRTLGGGGDVNKDGRMDLVIGAPDWDDGHGRVEVRTGGAILAPPPLWAAFEGQEKGRLGTAVGFAGDVDHDGHDEPMAGAPVTDGNDGRVFVWSGRTSKVIYARRGAQAERMGEGVAGGAKVDGDAYEDWAAGRPHAAFPVGGGPGLYSGAFTVFSGKNHWYVEGLQGFGSSVAVAGDLDGDGFEDFVIGRYGGDPLEGGWTLLSGFDAQVLFASNTSSGETCAGFAVAGAGDLDGDGRDGFLIAEPCGGDTRVTLYEGYSSETLTVLKTFHSPDGMDAGVAFGHSVAGVGDVDGDGVPDVLVGDPGHGPAAAQEAGAAWLFSGAPPYGVLAEHHGQPGDRLGHSVAAAEDVDLDGFPDYVVGLPHADDLFDEEGGAEAWSLSQGLLFKVGNTAAGNSHAGWSVAGVGDANADGYADVAVGEPDWQGAIAAKLGRVRVYAGPAGAVHLTLDGPFPGSRFGWALAPAGDPDADGHDDLAAGIPADPTNGGRVQILSGADGSLIHHSSAPFSGSNYGFSIGGSVDPGPDLRFETIAGAPDGDVFTDAYVKVLISPFYVVAPTGDTCTDDSTKGSYGMDMSPPYLGELVDVVVTDPPHPINALVLGHPAATPFLLGACKVYVDPSAPHALIPFVATETHTTPILFPDSPAFAGLKLAAQAFSLNMKVHATHGLSFTVGY